MGIFNKLKRIYYRIKNSDPLHNCEYCKDNWCNMVDGPFCTFPNCTIRFDYIGKEFVFCPDCVEFDDCLSGKFGLGCYNGKKCSDCENECENGKN